MFVDDEIDGLGVKITPIIQWALECSKIASKAFTVTNSILRVSWALRYSLTLVPTHFGISNSEWSLILFLMLKLLKPWSFLYCFTNRFHLTIYSLKIFQLETWEYRRTKFDLTVCCKIISHFSHIPYDSVFSFIVLRYKSSLPHAVFFINVNKNDSIHFSSKLSVAYLRACKHICDVYGILLLFEQSWT